MGIPLPPCETRIVINANSEFDGARNVYDIYIYVLMGDVLYFPMVYLEPLYALLLSLRRERCRLKKGDPSKQDWKPPATPVRRFLSLDASVSTRPVNAGDRNGGRETSYEISSRR